MGGCWSPLNVDVVNKSAYENFIRSGFYNVIMQQDKKKKKTKTKLWLATITLLIILGLIIPLTSDSQLGIGNLCKTFKVKQNKHLKSIKDLFVEIYDEDGNLIANGTTNSKGKVCFCPLINGVYTLKWTWLGEEMEEEIEVEGLTEKTNILLPKSCEHSILFCFVKSIGLNNPMLI